MSYETFRSLVVDLCAAVGLPDSDAVLQRGQVEVDGYLVDLDFNPEDDDAMSLIFDFGNVSAGRSLQVFRMMLEANYGVYASDQAILGMDGDTGNVTLLVRCPFSSDLDGYKLADTLGHYSEHGDYWRKIIFSSPDESYNSLLNGRYDWIRI